MNKKSIFKWLILSSAILFSSAGCSTFEKAILESKVTEKAVSGLKYKYLNNLDRQCRIEDFGFFSHPDNSPNEKVCYLVYGWGGSLKEFLDEDIEQHKKGQLSRLDIFREVFHNRIIIADYPSNLGMDEIFSELEKSFLEDMKEYSEENAGRKPYIVIVGHSQGAEISRMFVRNDSEYVKKAGLIAGVNEGLEFGALTDFIKKLMPQYTEKILEENNKPCTGANYQCIEDITLNSSVMQKLNTPTPPLDAEENFYAFESRRNNPLINFPFTVPNDGVTSVNSALSVNLIKDGNYEYVKIGDVAIFRGQGSYDVDHFSFDNLDILRQILISVKSEKQSSYAKFPTIENARKIIVPETTPLEKEIRQKEKELSSGSSAH